MNPEIGDVYKIFFPFTDGLSIKKRPVLVIAIQEYDLEVLYITTREYIRVYQFKPMILILDDFYNNHL